MDVCCCVYIHHTSGDSESHVVMYVSVVYVLAWHVIWNHIEQYTSPLYG